MMNFEKFADLKEGDQLSIKVWQGSSRDQYEEKFYALFLSHEFQDDSNYPVGIVFDELIGFDFNTQEYKSKKRGKINIQNRGSIQRGFILPKNFK